LVDRLLLAAEAGGRIGSVIETLLLQALAQHQQGRTPAALAALEHALTLAEPDGYVRIFVDEGPRMAELLDAAVKCGIVVGFVRALLPRFGAAEQRARSEQSFIKVEPLSERELDVLRLLASDLDGRDIARELTVSLSTMRTHTGSIFNKLGMSSRCAAVRRAEELRLL
jgi:LuxR family transcriptional regulator, maltose regulon positive regulatory protein